MPPREQTVNTSFPQSTNARTAQDASVAWCVGHGDTVLGLGARRSGVNLASQLDSSARTPADHRGRAERFGSFALVPKHALRPLLPTTLPPSIEGAP